MVPREAALNNVFLCISKMETLFILKYRDITVSKKDDTSDVILEIVTDGGVKYNCVRGFYSMTKRDETLTRMSGADCNLTAITYSCDVLVLNSLTIKLSRRNASV